MLSVLGKNQKMKSELVELHSEMLIIQSHRDELQTVLAGFDQSSDAFDVALKCIADLEWELRDAHKQITILDSQKNNRNMSHTQSLFEELICNSPTMCSANSPSNSDSPSVTIDLTESCRCNYEYEIQQLHSELSNMNKTLQEITYKYDMAQNEISEHALAMDELIKSSQYNLETFESLVTKNIFCGTPSQACRSMSRL
ncbi:unnamed protein product [Leptidea sinapis]|uniref:Uncharacterized protein n=1 Tax=Leptidea sinapis TaxID=189913 RepID=A0A5E4QJE7_9NEOP|nr:unnamed protein product [Leptidea sinapis]